MNSAPKVVALVNLRRRADLLDHALVYDDDAIGHR
jgi:hypothetical protein